MKPKEISSAYNQLTHIWTSDDFNVKNGIEQHKRAIKFVKVKKSALDVGCGCTGRFFKFLQSEGFQVEGVDVSDEMVRIAREKYPDLDIYNEDICQWDIPKKYDFITAWDSIWHIPLKEQKYVMSKLVNALNKNGVLIFSCGGTDHEGEHKDGSMGKEVYYSSLGINGFLELFKELGVVCRHLEYDQFPELHTYFIVQLSN